MDHPVVTAVSTGDRWPRPWGAIAFGALAAGMGWGIRGQYGHETGAMIAGVLFGFVIVLMACPGGPLLPALRAVALVTLAVGFGGSETYGQTIGLTQDAPLVGNGAALAWGMLGLAIKGGVWIGFAGVFLGMGLGGVRYRAGEMVILFLGMLLLMAVGIWWWNEPYDPARRVLPRFYFSDDWRWEPDAMLKPRRERWGGLWLALLGLVAYVRWSRGDRLAAQLGGWAMLGGALGFPTGQAIQAWHAWNRNSFSSGWAAQLEPVINWWNMMETTFGLVWGAVLALGVWRNRRWIALGASEVGRLGGAGQGGTEPGSARAVGSERDEARRSDGVGAWNWEWPTLGLFTALLLAWEFLDVDVLNLLAEPGISMGLVPAACVVAGRWWPGAVVFPLTLLPIAGKSIRHLVYEQGTISPAVGWLLLGVVPMVLGVLGAIWAGGAWAARSGSQPGLIGDGRGEGMTSRVLGAGLILQAWVFLGLNTAFFRFPWPWEPWTVRTPNQLIYLGCAAALTVLGWSAVRGRRWV